MKLTLQKIYSYGVLTLMICVQFLLISVDAYSQVTIDTFTHFEYVIYENSTAYLAVSEEGENLYIKNKTKSTGRINGRTKGLGGMKVLRNCNDVFWMNGKLYSLDFKTISDSIYSRVYGKIGDSFVVSKKGKVLLVDLIGNEKVICEVEDLSVFIRNNSILIENRYERRVYIYDKEANLTGIIDNVPYVNLSPNEYLVNVGIMDESVDAVTDVFDLKGKFLARGHSGGGTNDLLLFEDENKNKFLFLKDEKIALNPEWKSTIMYYEYLKVTLANGLKGILNSNLDIIVKPEFEKINILKEPSSNVYGICRFSCKDFFIANGVDGQISIFDSKGKYIEIETPLEVSKNTWVDQVYRYEFKNELLFYIYKNENKFKVFDDKWNYLSTLKWNKDLDEYYFNTGVPYWNSAPISLLNICKGKLRSDEFYVVKRNIKKRRWNICDINGNIILNDTRTEIKKLDRNIFMIYHMGIKPYIIRINAN